MARFPGHPRHFIVASHGSGCSEPSHASSAETAYTGEVIDVTKIAVVKPAALTAGDYTRELGWASDTWRTADLRFTLYTPFGPVGDPVLPVPTAEAPPQLAAVEPEPPAPDSRPRAKPRATPRQRSARAA